MVEVTKQQQKKKPRPGSIAEFVAQGGALPGSGKFDKEKVEADVAGRKEKKIKSVETPRDGVPPSSSETPSQTSKLDKFASAITPTLGIGIGGQMNLDRVKILVETGNWSNFVKGELIAATSLAGIAAVIGGGIALAGAGAGTIAGYTIGGTTTTGAVSTVGIATNGYTAAATTSMLSKIGLGGAAISILMSAIGTYPFSSFIKEEALQTLGFGVHSAMQAGDLESAELATAQIDEILKGRDGIISKLPGINLINSFKDFTDAAQTKNTIDKKIIEDKKIQRETGESESDKWTRIKEEENNQYTTNINYYNDQRKQMIIWEREAEVQARNEDAAFWRKEKDKQRKLEEEDRKAIAAFWEKYRKESAKRAEDSRPSKLNFGLI